jgi:hypothetical protein
MGGDEVRFGVIYEAYRYWTMRWKKWLGITIVFCLLVGVVAAIPAMAGSMVLVRVFGHVPKGGEHYWACLLMWIPVATLTTAASWALGVGVYRSAFRQLRGERLDNKDLVSCLSLFWVFLLPALLTQAAGYLATGCALTWLSWPAAFLLNQAVQPFVAAPFLFALPLMADKGCGLREACTRSLAATGPRFLAYGAVYWLLQAVPYGTPYLLLLVQQLAPLEPFAALVIATVFMPLPYIGVALLYRDRFPAPVAPPVLEG